MPEVENDLMKEIAAAGRVETSSIKVIATTGTATINKFFIQDIFIQAS
jgi:hypothetical protein